MKVNQWVVAVACSISAGISASFVQNSHFFVEEFRDHYDISYKEASIIPTILLVFLFLTVIAYLVALAVGFRKAMLLAGVCCSFSQIAAAYVTEFTLMVLLFGFASGFGCALGYNAPFMIVAQVLPPRSRNRGLAIVHFGSGFFMTIYPLIIGGLLRAFALRGAILILSGFSLQMIPLALLVPAVKPHAGRKDGDGYDSTDLKGKRGLLRVLTDRAESIFQVDLLPQSKMQALIFASYLIAIGSALIHSFTVSILTQDGGLSESTASIIASAGGAGLLVGKLVASCLSGDRVKHWIAFAVGGFIDATLTVVCGLVNYIGVYVATGAFIGVYVTLGYTFTIHSFIIIDWFPVEKFSLVFSYTVVAMMVACLTTPAIAGWLVDVTESFQVPLRIFGSIKAVVFLVPILYAIYCKLKQRKSTQNLTMTEMTYD